MYEASDVLITARDVIGLKWNAAEPRHMLARKNRTMSLPTVTRNPRRCLLLSYVFAPSTGGIESVSQTLAESLSRRNYAVRVVTQTAGHAGDERYRIVRRPSALQLLRQLTWCDVVLQSNFSMRLAWPLVSGLVSKPWVVVHHTPIARPSGELSVRDRLKLRALGRAQCYAVSNYLAKATPVASQVLLNPYDDSLFRLIDGISRERELIFVGRLVPAKGVDVLLRALQLLQRAGMAPRLSIVGSGPEEGALRQMTRGLNLGAQVEFMGRRHGEELARLLNAHRVMVVPSRAAPPEALGIVALEGIACGCVVIGAAQGGLPEAIGPCGVMFESESADSLARAIRESLASEHRQTQWQRPREAFLRPFRTDTVVDQYEHALERAISV